MSRAYIRITGLILLSYGLTGLVIADLYGWIRFSWSEVATTLIAGGAALWIGFRPTLARERVRATRVFGLSALTTASYGLWGPPLTSSTLEIGEMILLGVLGIIGIAGALHDDRRRRIIEIE